MSVGGNGRSLIALTANLSRQWAETREKWNDVKSEEFERRFLGELIESVPRAGAMFEELDKVLDRVRRECE